VLPSFARQNRCNRERVKRFATHFRKVAESGGERAAVQTLREFLKSLMFAKRLECGALFKTRAEKGF
jgi:hypothetical protein